jgi:OOP family OmpA-OmpF porin
MNENQVDVAQGLRSGRVTLQNVHFATGKADITPDSETSLANAVQAMKDNPDWKIRVEVFTDSTGDKAANLKLSEDRAEAVANWLADHGVGRSRLATTGYGEDKPFASNETQAGRRKNRRVELVRLS